MKTLQVERWPDRKRKVLSRVDGNTSTVLATFQTDQAAATFLETINALLTETFMQGVNFSKSRSFKYDK